MGPLLPWLLPLLPLLGLALPQGARGALGQGGPHAPQELAPVDRLGDKEPSCDQLRAMWRFSKRQSRAAQITNEIPTYRDPFAYPLWDAFPPGRAEPFPPAVPGQSLPHLRFRNGARPVYGRMVQHVPPRWRNFPASRVRYDEMARGGMNMNMYDPAARGRATARLSGGGAPPQQSGSFQHLKDIIRAERLRELQEQRLAEEAAARKEKEASKPHFGRMVNGPASTLDLVLASRGPDNYPAGYPNGYGGYPSKRAQPEQPAVEPDSDAALDAVLDSNPPASRQIDSLEALEPHQVGGENADEGSPW